MCPKLTNLPQSHGQHSSHSYQSGCSCRCCCQNLIFQWTAETNDTWFYLIYLHLQLNFQFDFCLEFWSFGFLWVCLWSHLLLQLQLLLLRLLLLSLLWHIIRNDSIISGPEQLSSCSLGITGNYWNVVTIFFRLSSNYLISMAGNNTPEA